MLTPFCICCTSCRFQSCRLWAKMLIFLPVQKTSVCTHCPQLPVWCSPALRGFTYIRHYTRLSRSPRCQPIFLRHDFSRKLIRHFLAKSQGRLQRTPHFIPPCSRPAKAVILAAHTADSDQKSTPLGNMRAGKPDCIPSREQNT